MQAEIRPLAQTQHFAITDFRCQCMECSRSAIEYQAQFSICFVRKGNFYFNVFKQTLDAFSGYILINKPGYEYTVSHVAGLPDEVTILSFSTDFYEQIKAQLSKEAAAFFEDKDQQSLRLQTSPALECVHRAILQELQKPHRSNIVLEGLVMDVVQGVLAQMGQTMPEKVLPANLKRNHLRTIEDAIAYMGTQLSSDWSLVDLARHCHVSPFHFSRIFKHFTQHAPNQYLQAMRLKQAELLLKTTMLPVTDVAFSAGFNSIDYFSAAFKLKYQQSPSAFRATVCGRQLPSFEQ